jgi:hypothetical protein
MQLSDESALMQEILRIEKRVAHLGENPKVQKKWGLSGGRLRVVLGSDNECYVRYKNSGKTIGYEPNLISDVYAACRSDLMKRPIIDSKALEFNLEAARAAGLIARHKRLFDKAGALIDKAGLNFAAGAGHWHLSLVDEGAEDERQHVLNNQNRTDSDRYAGSYLTKYSAFAEKLAANLIALQSNCPALFLRPSRAEKPADGEVYTSTLAYARARSGTIQMDGEKYPSGAYMFEMRIAHLAPYVPIMMMLHAVERTLKGETIAPYEGLDDGAVGLGDRFVRGPGCYLDYLRLTEKAGYLAQHFPDLAENLMRDSVKAYALYLQTPAWSKTYTAVAREAQMATVRATYEKTPYRLAPPNAAEEALKDAAQAEIEAAKNPPPEAKPTEPTPSNERRREDAPNLVEIERVLESLQRLIAIRPIHTPFNDLQARLAEGARDKLPPENIRDFPVFCPPQERAAQPSRRPLPHNVAEQSPVDVRQILDDFRRELESRRPDSLPPLIAATAPSRFLHEKGHLRQLDRIFNHRDPEIETVRENLSFRAEWERMRSSAPSSSGNGEGQDPAPCSARTGEPLRPANDQQTSTTQPRGPRIEPAGLVKLLLSYRR